MNTCGQPASIEEHVMRLMSLMNKLLDKHAQCRYRSLNWHIPLIIPIWIQRSFVEEDPSITSYADAFENYCVKYKKEPDYPILHFKSKIYSRSDNLEAETLRSIAFHEISKTVSESLFSHYMYKSLPSCNHLWIFKKQFCNNMALSSFVAMILHIGGRIPGKILFSKSTGTVFQVLYNLLFIIFIFI